MEVGVLFEEFDGHLLAMVDHLSQKIVRIVRDLSNEQSRSKYK